MGLAQRHEANALTLIPQTNERIRMAKVKMIGTGPTQHTLMSVTLNSKEANRSQDSILLEAATVFSRQIGRNAVILDKKITDDTALTEEGDIIAWVVITWFGPG